MKGVKMTMNEILENNKLIAITNFQIKEVEKILVRVKELNKKYETLKDKNSKAGLNILAETQRLIGKLEGINLIMDELELIAKNTFSLMR